MVNMTTKYIDERECDKQEDLEDKAIYVKGDVGEHINCVVQKIFLTCDS